MDYDVVDTRVFVCLEEVQCFTQTQHKLKVKVSYLLSTQNLVELGVSFFLGSTSI